MFLVLKKNSAYYDCVYVRLLCSLAQPRKHSGFISNIVKPETLDPNERRYARNYDSVGAPQKVFRLMANDSWKLLLATMVHSLLLLTLI